VKGASYKEEGGKDGEEQEERVGHRMGGGGKEEREGSGRSLGKGERVERGSKQEIGGK